MAKRNQYFPQSVPHPGETLAEKLEEMAMPINEFALRTGKPEKTIIAILKGESAITPDMAVQFEHVTKIPARFWMNHQLVFDEYMARLKRKPIIDAAVPWSRMFPLADMISKGWLPPVSSQQEKASALLSFFGFSHHTAWEDYYFHQQLKIAFRISLANTNDAYAISAWLRKGELQAEEIQATVFSKQKFKTALPVLKSLMSAHPKDFFYHLQCICLDAGVKVVYTPFIQKAPISGATRWLNGTPVIQLTCRYNRNDIFWFTFFHEAGHILLHGKKDIFLEKVTYCDKDLDKEKEADAFACKWTLSEQEEAAVLAEAPLSEDLIRKFAKKFNTHPAIIIGRLQHKKLIPYSFGKKYIEPVILA